jgi:hypothetical protein
MSRVHIHGATRASIIKERTCNWVATSTATRHLCLRHCTDGNVLWALWERVGADQGDTRYISCDVLLPHATGWGYKAMLEQDEPEHLSCPPSYLRESPALSEAWRDQVRAYWNQRRTNRPALSALATERASAQRFKEGDRVRYIGPESGGLRHDATGMVVRGKGPCGSSIYADELCNSLFVNWDRTSARAIFAAHLAHQTLSASYPADELSSGAN